MAVTSRPLKSWPFVTIPLDLGSPARNGCAGTEYLGPVVCRPGGWVWGVEEEEIDCKLRIANCKLSDN